ncbi:25304_t:CDS:2, partial [Gigaspora rosea]
MPLYKKQHLLKKKELEKELNELQDMARITTNPEYLRKLKKTHGKLKKITKKKLLEEEQLVIRYDSPGCPPLLFEYPDLHDHIHSCIKFGEADAQRRHGIIKVRTINHLRSSLEEKYN